MHSRPIPGHGLSVVSLLLLALLGLLAQATTGVPLAVAFLIAGFIFYRPGK